jgi:hypothetical protein
MVKEKYKKVQDLILLKLRVRALLLKTDFRSGIHTEFSVTVQKHGLIWATACVQQILYWSFKMNCILRQIINSQEIKYLCNFEFQPKEIYKMKTLLLFHLTVHCCQQSGIDTNNSEGASVSF